MTANGMVPAVLLPRQQVKLVRGAKDKEHATSQTPNTAIAAIGIDIGKNSFHVVGHDARGAIVLRQKWSRGQVEARLANMPPCLIGMEACVGAHHLSRKLKALGQDARLMPAKYVRPYSKGQKALPQCGGNHRGRAAADHEVRGDEDCGSTRSASIAPGAGTSTKSSFRGNDCLETTTIPSRHIMPVISACARRTATAAFFRSFPRARPEHSRTGLRGLLDQSWVTPIHFR
jgi:hypothetical protein